MWQSHSGCFFFKHTEAVFVNPVYRYDSASSADEDRQAEQRDPGPGRSRREQTDKHPQEDVAAPTRLRQTLLLLPACVLGP